MPVPPPPSACTYILVMPTSSVLGLGITALQIRSKYNETKIPKPGLILMAFSMNELAMRGV